MSELKRKWEKLTDQQRSACINELIDFFEAERDEQIGTIAAGEILDTILRTAGKSVYNRGVQDAINTMEERLEDVKVDVESLLD